MEGNHVKVTLLLESPPPPPPPECAGGIPEDDTEHRDSISFRGSASGDSGLYVNRWIKTLFSHRRLVNVMRDVKHRTCYIISLYPGRSSVPPKINPMEVVGTTVNFRITPSKGLRWHCVENRTLNRKIVIPKITDTSFLRRVGSRVSYFTNVYAILPRRHVGGSRGKKPFKH